MSQGDLPPATGMAVLKAAGRRLDAAGVASGQGDAMHLMTFAFGADVPRYALMDQLRAPLPGDVAARFEAAVVARLRRQPVSQIIGSRLFWSHRFLVTPDTLDPRPETETLVALALEQPFQRVLDLGTGTGAIAISLLDACPQGKGVATDLSEGALKVAAQNAVTIGVADRLDLIRSDWFSAVEGEFDLIVSNPPYIAVDEMDGLAPEVRDWEPRMALTDGGDGLMAYRVIARDAPRHLVSGGRLIVEIGAGQAADVTDVFWAAGLDEVSVTQDLDGRDRVVSGRRVKDEDA